MNSISSKYENNVNAINELVNKAVKEIKVANVRAESAEKMLVEFRKSFETELNNAYNEGYKRGIQEKNDVDGGTTKTEDYNKLVLKAQN